MHSSPSYLSVEAPWWLMDTRSIITGQDLSSQDTSLSFLACHLVCKWDVTEWFDDSFVTNEIWIPNYHKAVDFLAKGTSKPSLMVLV